MNYILEIKLITLIMGLILLNEEEGIQHILNVLIGLIESMTIFLMCMIKNY